MNVSSLFFVILSAICNTGAGVALKSLSSRDVLDIKSLSVLSISLLFYFLAFSFYMLSMKSLPLQYAYLSITSLSMVFLMLYSVKYLGSTLLPINIVGVFLVFGGLLLVMKR